MPATFAAASGEVIAVLNAAVRKYRPKFIAEEVKIGVLMAANHDGPALTAGGYPAAAMVKVVPLADRVSKGYDAEIRINEDTWSRLTDKGRLALFHHELCHLQLVYDQYGELKLDDLGRPKLKGVKADWNGGDGFREVVEEHGEFAVERMNAMRVEAAVRGCLNRRAGLFDAVDPAEDATS